MSKTKKSRKQDRKPQIGSSRLLDTAKTALTIIAALVGILTFVLYTFPGQILPKNIWYQCSRADKNRIVVVVANFSGEDSEIDERIYRVLQERVDTMRLTDRVQVLRFEHITPKTMDEAEDVARRCDSSLVIWGIGDSLGVDVFHTKFKWDGLISIKGDFTLATPELDHSIPNLDHLKFYIQVNVPQQYDYLMLVTVAQIALFSGEPEVALPMLGEAANLGESLALPMQNYENALGAKAAELCLECTFFYRANANYYLGNYEEALKDLDRVLESNPRDTLAIHNRGDVYVLLDRLDDALNSYNTAIELHERDGVSNPAIAFSYNNRGVVYERLGEDALAISDYWTATELDREYAVPYFNLAGYHKNKGQLSLALQMLDKAIEIDPNYINALFRRGQYRYESGDYTHALDDYSEVVDVVQDSAVVYYERGNTYDELKRYSLAIADYQKAISLDPNYVDALNNLGLSIMKQGNYRQSIVYYERAIEIDEKSPGPYINEARAYELMGEYESCIQLLDRGLSAGVEPVQIYVIRARINSSFGHYDLAIKDYKYILDNIDPSDPLYSDVIQKMQQLEQDH